MSRSKTNTPVIEEHPAHKLSFVDSEIKDQLLKTPPQLLLENENYKIQLRELRNDWKFAFVIQWLYYFRGAIKLSGEPLTIDLIEEELVGLTEPNLTTRIATNLASALIGNKVTLEDFSFKVRYLFGDSIDLLGTEDNPKEYSNLSLIEKFDVLYNLIFQLQYLEVFKNQVNKYEKENELRFEPIFEDFNKNNNELENYFLLSDNRIYKQILFNFPNLNIPKKYKNSKNFIPEFELDSIEPESKWECVAIGIYELHEFIESIKSIKRLKPLFQNIKQHINDLALEDLSNRKKIVKRKREQQLHELVNNRKRSSRLQEKDEQNKIDQEKKLAELEQQREEQLKIKTKRNLKKKESLLKKDIEDRLRRQQQQNTSSRNSTITLDDLKPLEEKELIELDEGDWLFECGCGIRQKNFDDGVKLIVCERCQRWQHLKCQPRIVQQELVKNSNDVFVCDFCKHDLEIEIIKKLNDERIKLEQEHEEKLKRKEEKRLKKLQEIADLEEAERLKKEELEKERERRILEREKLRDASSTDISVSSTPIPQNTPIPQITPTIQHQQQQQQPTSNPYQNGPSFGTFQVSPSHQSPQSQQFTNQSNNLNSGYVPQYNQSIPTPQVSPPVQLPSIIHQHQQPPPQPQFTQHQHQHQLPPVHSQGYQLPPQQIPQNGYHTPQNGHIHQPYQTQQPPQQPYQVPQQQAPPQHSFNNSPQQQPPQPQQQQGRSPQRYIQLPSIPQNSYNNQNPQ